METNETPLNPEYLLEQTGWIHALAARLVVAPDLREDVAQEALRIALERRSSVLNPRAWLTRLVRNTAWEWNRSEQRRRLHQQRAAREESSESPDQLVAQAELQGRIVVAVTRLKEPYRSTMLQRYFRQRSAEDIARREGIPAATVRTRLKRALDQLREEFREDQESQRGAWLGLVLPLASTETTLVTTAAALTAGGLTMKLGTWLLGIAALGLAVAVLVIPWTDEGTSASSLSVDAETAGPGTPGGAAAPTVVADPVPAAPFEEVPSREAVVPAGTVLSGRVVDLGTDQPVTSFHVVLSREHGIGEAASGPRQTVVREDLTDPSGSFRFPLTETGVYRLRVQSSRYRSAASREVTLDGPGGITDLLIELDPGLAVSGRVVDHESGLPIEGAVVGTNDGTRLTYFLAGEPERCLHAVTDENGRFRLSGLEPENQKIAAVHDDYAEAWLPVVPGQVEAIEIRMKRGPHLFGTVLDDAGRPKEGVWITLYGPEIPLARPVVTGPDGTYRTPPVRPGTVELRARPPEGETEDSFGFSAEWASAQVLDGDVRVDFGVRTDYVTWRGTLYGKDGQPLPEANLYLHLSLPSYVGYERLLAHSRDADCDGEGRFEFRKLPPGCYQIRPYLAGSSYLDSPIPIALETPGLHEEDIRLDQRFAAEACRIRGVVIDEATGMPIETDGRVTVMVSQYSPTFRSWYTTAEAGGKFLIEDLPAGRHQVSAHAKGWTSQSVRVVLREDQPADDLQIVLPRSGTMLLRLAGFREFAPRKFRFVYRSAEEGHSRQHDDQLPENGNYEISWPLLPGSWTVTVSLEELGVAERSFSVHEGRATEVVIRPEDLRDATTTVTVAGDVRREDGTPVPGVSVSFWGGDIPGIAKADRSRSVTTNDAGEFEIAGLLAGRWGVRGTIRGTSVTFSELAIPLEAADPHPLHLVLPGGRLTGTLFNKRTGLALGDDAPPRWLFLGKVGGGQNVCEIQNGQTGSRFEMEGIPEGDYVLTVTTRVFANHVSDAFHHPGTGALDLGRIELEPCGVLELEVVDEAGLFVPEFDVYLDGRALWSWDRKSLGEGRFLLSHLPLGKATIEVRAVGFRTCSQELLFGADGPTRHSFVLKRL